MVGQEGVVVGHEGVVVGQEGVVVGQEGVVLWSPRKNFLSVYIPANGEGARDLNPLPGSEKLPTTTVPPKREDFSDQI